MRIRAIKPEFWRSDDITSLSREHRLLFIGLWSYVDDNGVGVDDYRAIAADLFALEDDQNEVRAYVRDGLATLSRALLIARYEVGGKRYIFIRTWDSHQKIDRPSKARHPRPEPGWTPPTSDDDDEPRHLFDVSRETREGLDAGTGEQGNRGRTTSVTADASTHADTLPLPDVETAHSPDDEDAEFEAWWSVWPRKVAKGGARKSYRAARRKKVSAEQLREAAIAQAAAWKAAGKDSEYIPHATTWLNQERYNDEVERPKFTVITNPDSPWAGQRIENSESPWAADMGWTS